LGRRGRNGQGKGLGFGGLGRNLGGYRRFRQDRLSGIGQRGGKRLLAGRAFLRLGFRQIRERFRQGVHNP
jgi:hypothetical protein